MKKTASIIVGLLALGMPFITSAATITHSLAVGSKGDEVTALQSILVSLKFLKVTPTGYFGALTKQAVMAYQKSKGLEQVGIVGPKTRLLLNGSSAGTVTNLTPIPPISVPTTPQEPQIPYTNPTPTPSPVTPAPTPAPVTPPTPTPTPSPSPNDPPKITIISPNSVVPRNMYDLTFAVATDKAAYCKYGTQPGMILSYMTSFQTTGTTMHSSYLSGLQQGGLYIYYVKCEDMSAHVSQETTVSFSLTGE